MDNIKSALDTSKDICNKYPSFEMHIDCANVLSPLESLYVNVYNNYLSLSHLTSGSNQKRKRSAWFGVGGTILKQLFGSLDDDDAKVFSDAIDSVQDDQRQLASLMKDNIHIIASTISTFNNTILKLNANEITLNNNMDKLHKILDTISQNTNKLEINTHLSMTFSALESSLMILNFNLRDLIDAILFGKQNVVHPAVLNPIRLFEELNSNSNIIARNFPLPLSLDNVHILLDIADISSFVSDNKLVFNIRIPLTLVSDYKLYHIYALPTPHDIQHPNSFAMINPTAKYLSITEDKLTYSLLDNISECKVIKNSYYLCKIESVHSSVSNPVCEVTILTEYLNKIPSTCNYKVMVGNIDVWQKLTNNRWIYVLSDISKLSVNCNDQIVDYDLIGTGILKLPKGCKAYHKLLQFVATNEYQSKIYLPSLNFNIIEDDCCSKKTINNSLPYLTPIKLSHINLDSLQYASHKLNQATEELDRIEKQPYYVKYGHYFNIITTLLSVCVFSYLLYKIYKCFCQKKRNHRTSVSPTGCCIKIFNSCYSKPRNSVQSVNRSNSNILERNNTYEMSSVESGSNNSINTPRRNLDFQ